ncbi:hypothetical protein C1H46_003372 [Malus baccata]|uniref:Uncharacterized protein n=1 Tax=Malus baccata TaxID=106549 RepID=A0A540NIT2_MALBA|nr:hypothetical protein C1H46_003372 [Malus baccata]
MEREAHHQEMETTEKYQEKGLERKIGEQKGLEKGLGRKIEEKGLERKIEEKGLERKIEEQKGLEKGLERKIEEHPEEMLVQLICLKTVFLAGIVRLVRSEKPWKV